MRQKLMVPLIITCIPPKSVFAQEASPLTGSSANLVDNVTPTALNDLNFHSTSRTANDEVNSPGGGFKELSLQLQEEYKFMNIYVQNFPSAGAYTRTWSNSKLFLGTDLAYNSSSLTQCADLLNDTAIVTLPELCRTLSSKVIAFRRESSVGVGSSDFIFISAQIRGYQNPLLSTLPGMSLTFSVEHTQATVTGTPENLFSNYNSRAIDITRNPWKDSSWNTETFNSCYKAQCIAPACLDTNFGLIVNFNQSVFLHPLLMVLDGQNHATTNTVSSFEIYAIAEDGTQTLCSSLPSNQIGYETFPNKEIMALRIVGIPINSADWEVTLCVLGLMGTKYVRSITVPTSFSMQQGVQTAALTIDHIQPKTGFEISNVLDINLRQKADTVLSWVTIVNDATTAQVQYDLCPPVGSHQLNLESIDLNSPLYPSPTVLKTDVINISVEGPATNQLAFDCRQLSAAGQTNQVNETYEVHSGNQDVTLPVINYLPGFTISQELQSGVLTHANGTTQTFAAGDTAALAAIGVTIVTNGSAATLKVDISNIAYYDATLALTIKDTLVEESTWFDTTQVTLTLTRPTCLVTQAWLTSQEVTPALTLTASQLTSTDTLKFSDLQTIADTVFKKVTDPTCGAICFSFNQDASQPFTYDSGTQVFTFSPQLVDAIGSVMNQSAQFYFVDFPNLIWNAPIQLDTLACGFSTNQEAFDCGQLSAAGQTNQVNTTYEVHSGNKYVPLPVINHLQDFTISQEFQSGVLTHADGTSQNIAAGDTAALAAIGVTLVNEGSTATLKVDVNDQTYYGSTLKLTIKDTLVEEPTWFDTTQVTINLQTTVRFEHKPELVTLSVGQEYEWTLPKVVNSFRNNYEITMEPDLLLVPYLSYRRENDSVLFNGADASNQLVGKFLQVRYTIVDSLGKKFESVQNIQVKDQFSSLQEPILAEKESELEEPNSEPLASDSQAIQSQLPEAQQLATTEKIERLAEGLDKVAGIPLDVVVQPMTNEELELAETPANEIPVSKLFFPVPLEARMTQGVTNLKDFVLRQREQITQMAISSSSEKAKPVEARVKSMSNSGSLSMGFMPRIAVPEGETEVLQAQNVRNRKLMARGNPPEKQLITLYAVKEQVSEEEFEKGEQIMDGWDLISFNPDGIDFRLNYKNPIYISQGEAPDLILIQLDLSDYKDENGEPFPASIVKYYSIPTQMGTKEEAERVELQGATASESSQTAVITNVAVNVLLAKSMNKIWDMIEGLQVAYHLPLFKVHSPGNVNAFNNFFEEIGGFDFIDVTDFTQQYVYFPEIDAVTLNFQMAGFDSNLVIPNLGFKSYLFIAHFLLAPFVILLYFCSKKLPKLKQVANKAHSYLFWGGSIRFFMEGYLDFCTLGLMNIKTLDWESQVLPVIVCNYAAIFIVFLACALPVFVLVFYIWRRNVWHTEEFQQKWGFMLDDLAIDKEDAKWVIVLQPFSYFLRRLAFSAVLIFWYDFIWGQIAIMAMLSTAMIIFIQWFKPIDSTLITNIETFNECIALCTIYLVMSMSDAVQDVEVIVLYGQGYIAVLGLYLAVHVLNLTGDIMFKIKDKCKSCFSKCTRKKSQQETFKAIQVIDQRLIELDIIKCNIYEKRAKRLGIASPYALSENDENEQQPSPSAVIVIKPMRNPSASDISQPSQNIADQDQGIESSRESQIVLKTQNERKPTKGELKALKKLRSYLNSIQKPMPLAQDGTLNESKKQTMRVAARRHASVPSQRLIKTEQNIPVTVRPAPGSNHILQAPSLLDISEISQDDDQSIKHQKIVLKSSIILNSKRAH